MSKAIAIRENNIDSYMAAVNRHPLLSRDEEFSIAKRYKDDGDVTAAHKLVVSNLRFVVKIAHEYRNYGFKTLDLVQEGNVGLMMAVKKFDPDRGYRLISYAVWWIRAQIQGYIQRSWSMVKVGMTSPASANSPRTAWRWVITPLMGALTHARDPHACPRACARPRS